MWTAVIAVCVVALVVLEAADKIAVVKIRQRLDMLEKRVAELDGPTPPVVPTPQKRTAWD